MKSMNNNIVSAVVGLTILFFAVVLNVYGSSTLVTLLGYGSSSDYTNPQTTFSGTTSVGSGQTLTGTTQVIFTQPVQLTSGSVNVIIPQGTQVTTSSGGNFDATQISTTSLSTLPLVIASNEQDVGKIQFGVTTAKLNFSKPVRIQIPVSTSAATVTVKVKHFGDASYTVSSLTNTYSSNCIGGNASSVSNIASVSNGIATIYTCSASDFIALVPKTQPVVSSSSGGGGVSVRVDYCPGGDYSPSYYDNSCGARPTLTTPTTVVTQDTVSLPSKKPSVGQQLRYKFVPVLNITSVKYKGYSISVINGYAYSQTAKQIALKVIDSETIASGKKGHYVGIINNYLVSRYKYDLSVRQAQLEKNKFNKNTLLMKAVLRQVSK